MFWRQRAKPLGDIAGSALTDWWLEMFTKEQHDYIADWYQPMGLTRPRLLVEGEPRRQDAGKVPLGLSSEFCGP